MKLLPCPFCGSGRITLQQGYASCDHCHADGPFKRDSSDRKYAAALSWNNRIPIEQEIVNRTLHVLTPEEGAT